ncbi:MAG: peptidase M22 [Opitutus sp.]
MSSFRQILAHHGSILLLDACSARIQVGWRDGPENEHWTESSEEAGLGLFKCLSELGVSLPDVSAFVFCDGPGSILGIRTSAVALRTWNVLTPRPCFSYHSLELVAHAQQRPELTVIADARRDTWHAVSLDTTLRRVAATELVGALAMPEGFRHWSTPPPRVEHVPYKVRSLISQCPDADIFRGADSPDAFLHEEPSYVTWTPQIHRAP